MVVFFAILFFAAAALGFIIIPSMGHSPSNEQATRFTTSPQYSMKGFANTATAPVMQGNPISIAKEMFSSNNRKPPHPLPVHTLHATDFGTAHEAIRVYWLGHSSLILEMEGKRFIIDPVLDRYASPMPGFVGRFQPAAITREELPPLDGVIISHNHYDHLEKKTVQFLATRGVPFFTPLGVGSYLESWGISRDRITEFDWWDSIALDGLHITAVPSQHFSGRGITDRNKSLWAGWAFTGTSHRAYYSSDGGWGTHFEEIGKRLGPFDLTMIETGAYSKNWPFIHILPEKAVEAHIAVQGKFMVPVHWGTFDLSTHAWDEPVNRASAYARERGVTFCTPELGMPFIPGETSTTEWWRSIL